MLKYHVVRPSPYLFFVLPIPIGVRRGLSLDRKRDRKCLWFTLLCSLLSTPPHQSMFCMLLVLLASEEEVNHALKKVDEHTRSRANMHHFEISSGANHLHSSIVLGII